MIPTPNTLATALEAAYAYLEACLHQAQQLTQAATEGKVMVAEARQGILLQFAEDPKQLGANEAARNAAVDNLCKDARETLAKLESEANIARNMLEIARVRVEGLRAQLRCAELARGKEEA